MENKLPYLNLGCGLEYHKDWTNIDFISTGEGVMAYNLTKGIPYPDKSFEVVYHSHVLEHFSKEGGKNFLQECYRVLKDKGIIRIAIPDLENIVRQYLQILSELRSNPESTYLQACYDWILLEMYDQTVRNESGGNMYSFIKQSNIINEDFLIKRCGYEVQSMIKNLKSQNDKPKAEIKPSVISRLKALLNPGSLPHTIKQTLIRKVLGKEYRVYEIGKFRVGGEIHQWMYDQYSLSRLLKQIGFSEIQVQSASSSKIAKWEDFGLEITDDKVRKPDSLFIEAIKN